MDQWAKMGLRIFTAKSFVGNRAKERISKRVFQENKVRQIFRKRNISYPLICTPTRYAGNNTNSVNYSSLTIFIKNCKNHIDQMIS